MPDYLKTLEQHAREDTQAGGRRPAFTGRAHRPLQALSQDRGTTHPAHATAPAPVAWKSPATARRSSTPCSSSILEASLKARGKDGVALAHRAGGHRRLRPRHCSIRARTSTCCSSCHARPTNCPKPLQELVQDVLYLLWDVGFKVGHACRSIVECIEQAKLDQENKTSLMDARLITGDADLFEQFQTRFAKECIDKGQAGVLRTAPPGSAHPPREILPHRFPAGTQRQGKLRRHARLSQHPVGRAGENRQRQARGSGGEANCSPPPPAARSRRPTISCTASATSSTTTPARAPTSSRSSSRAWSPPPSTTRSATSCAAPRPSCGITTATPGISISTPPR